MKRQLIFAVFACVAFGLAPLERGAGQQPGREDAPANASAAARYVIFDADCTSSGICAAPVGVDSQGTVAGNFHDETDHIHGFYRLADGTIVNFDAPGATCVDAYPTCTNVAAISPTGFIVGNYNGDGGGMFLRSPSGTFAEFGVPNALGNGATAVNAAGTVTGYWTDGDYNLHGFVRDASGTITSFDAPNAGPGGTWPVVINANGDIAGFSSSSSTTTAFLRYADGTVDALDLPCPSLLEITAIDDGGRVLGNCETQKQANQAFYGDPKHGYTTFTVPGSEIVGPTGIDRNGTIAGNYNVAGNGHLFGFYRLKDGTIGYVEPPDFKSTAVLAIGPQGIIAGVFTDASKKFHAFLRIS